ncbi:hypothetical protein C0J52_11799 [Blattella germanica]|nr:hypothetical protein C0J52_11799 [Blattella germanica]
MSYYYYQLPQAEELDDTMYSGGSLRHTTNRGRTSHHQPYRPRSSTDSIPFVDADQPRSRDPATSSSEETVNRLASYPQTDPRGGAASLRRRRRYPPPPPSPPATFLDSEDATSLNNLLDALDDLDVEEDRRSSLATTGSSRDDEVEEAVVPHNGPPRPTLASILVSIPPPPTPPPPENEMSIEQRQELQKLRQLQKHPMRRINPSSAANHNVSFVLPPPPPSPPKEHPQPKCINRHLESSNLIACILVCKLISSYLSLTVVFVICMLDIIGFPVHWTPSGSGPKMLLICVEYTPAIPIFEGG